MDGNKNQSPASKALSEILDTVRENTKVLKNCVNVLCENNNLLKQKQVNNSAKLVNTDMLLNYIASKPMYNLTPRQIYYMVERGDDMRYIQAVSGYSVEDIKKKYEQHRKNNVYR